MPTICIIIVNLGCQSLCGLNLCDTVAVIIQADVAIANSNDNLVIVFLKYFCIELTRFEFTCEVLGDAVAAK